MAQKYKVFQEEKEIYFTDFEITDVEKIAFSFADNYESLFQKIGMYNQIIAKNPSKAMKRFFRKFQFIEAAGGMVRFENEFLFIKRNGLWDIPKGKLEKNESPENAAIREIGEECGLTGELVIRKKIVNTFHVYKLNDISVLKKTHWYLLDYFGDKYTKPQLEEGISEVRWFSKSNMSMIKTNTYPSILDVIYEIELD
jgi:8-oxo-dGTP pyrophosphatase MutT (NUDIX family)